MKKLIDFFIERSLLVNLITFMIILVGIITAYGLQKETFPRVEFDVILITTTYPGSTSEDVEKLVTISIERELKSVDGIKEINAMSAEGRSIIYLEVEPDADVDEVIEDVKTQVETVDDLPEDAKIPRVRSLNNKTRGIIKVPLVGGTYDQLRTASKKLRDRIERIRGVAYVELDGYEKDEIRIEVDPNKMARYELTLLEIQNALRLRNLNLSAGKIETKAGDVSLRTVNEFVSLKEIEDLVVISNDSGQRVRLKELAKVTRAPDEGAVLQRSMGERAVFLDVKSRESADILKTTQKVKDITEKFMAEYPVKEIRSRFTDDYSYYVKRRLNILKNNGLLGIGLVFCCLLLFLNFSTSVITSLGAPIAFMASFIIMQMTGVSINLISMFALILVLGMLVDDSIIVAEHFYQKLEKGYAPKTAAREAALETIKPVTATILTTMVAFGSLFFMGGIMGKFLWSVPAVVIICLIASWLECFFILPSHLNDFCRLKKKKEVGSRWYDPIVKVYSATLKPVLNNPLKIVFLFGVILAGSGFLAKTMNFELFPGDDVRVVFLQVKGKVGTPLEKTDRAVIELEKLVMQLPSEELDQTKAQVGLLRGDQGRKTGSHYGSVVIYLTPPDVRERTTDEIVKDLTKKAKPLVPDYQVLVKKIQGGPPKGKPVEIDLIGDNIETLKTISHKIYEVLKKEEGVTSAEVDFEEGKQQIVANVDDQESRRLGVSTTDVAMELRRAFAGDSSTEVRESDEDIEIKVMLDRVSRAKESSIEKLFILNKEGRRIPISKVVKFEKKPGAFVIRRLNGKRVFSISGVLDKAKTTPVKVAEKMTPIVKDLIKDHPDMDFIMGGENEDTKESMARLTKSAVIAMLCIFFILVVMFSSFGQPLVIMAAIPLGMIGVIIAFKIFGYALGFMALMGVVGLVGVVVNDSIVLVTFINEKRADKSLSLVQAVHDACLSRLRPVLLTTFTTVAGLLPVAHAPGGDPFLKPMALSFAYGLLFATFVTLVFVPSCYVIYDKTYHWLLRIIGKDPSSSVPGGLRS